MNRIAVKSEKLSSVGYNPRIYVLELEFADGSIHVYFNVPNDIFESLMGSDSHSQYYEDYIKSQFKSRKVS